MVCLLVYLGFTWQSYKLSTFINFIADPGAPGSAIFVRSQLGKIRAVVVINYSLIVLTFSPEVVAYPGRCS